MPTFDPEYWQLMKTGIHLLIESVEELGSNQLFQNITVCVFQPSLRERHQYPIG